MIILYDFSLYQTFGVRFSLKYQSPQREEEDGKGVFTDKKAKGEIMTRDVKKTESAVTLLLYSIDNCPHCERMERVFRQLESDLDNVVRVGKIDCSKSPEVSEKARVSKFPTVVAYRNGEEMWRFSGEIPAVALETRLIPSAVA